MSLPRQSRSSLLAPQPTNVSPLGQTWDHTHLISTPFMPSHKPVQTTSIQYSDPARPGSSYLMPVPSAPQVIGHDDPRYGLSRQSTPNIHSQAQLDMLLAQMAAMQQQLAYYQPQSNSMPKPTGSFNHNIPDYHQGYGPLPHGQHPSQSPHQPFAQYGDDVNASHNSTSRSSVRSGHGYGPIVVKKHGSVIVGNVGDHPYAKSHEYERIEVDDFARAAIGDMSTPALREYQSHPYEAGITYQATRQSRPVT